jgi:hypothetical protein
LRGENRRVPVSAVTARRLQGGWYVVNGIWPLLSMRSFEAVSGPKPDAFQTRTAAVLFLAAGLALQPWSDQPSTDGTRILAAASAAGTAGVIWAHARSLRRPLLAESLLEAGFATAALRGRR